jgi:hypothetical protein
MELKVRCGARRKFIAPSARNAEAARTNKMQGERFRNASFATSIIRFGIEQTIHPEGYRVHVEREECLYAYVVSEPESVSAILLMPPLRYY